MAKTIHLEARISREADGRYIADIEEIPGALAYGITPQEAALAAGKIAAEVIKDRKKKNHPRRKKGK